MTDLPDYVAIKKFESVLITPSQEVTFPLSEKDRHIIDVLIAKFKNEKNCAGLAAPQLGFDRRIIVFEVKDDPSLKKWRPDLTDTLPMALWINPSYKGIGEEKISDYEGCFSIEGLGGTVARFKKVSYKAYDSEGLLIQGTAEGFLARVIQHEVDHINGILFPTLVSPGELLPIEIYRKKRERAMKQGRENIDADNKA